MWCHFSTFIRFGALLLKKCHLRNVYHVWLSIKYAHKGLIEWDSSFQRSVFVMSWDALKTVTLSAVAAIEEWCTVVTCQALRILTAQVKLLLIQKWCACPCFAHIPMCLVDVIWLECVCVPLCVCMSVLPAERRLIRPWQYPLWQHIRTSLSLFWHPPLITALQLFDCSFIVLSKSLSWRGFCDKPGVLGIQRLTKEKDEEIQSMVKNSGNKNTVKCLYELLLTTVSDWGRSLSYYDEIIAWR